MLDLCFIVPDSEFLQDKFVIPNLTPILLKSFLLNALPEKKIKIIYLSEKDKNDIPESKFYGISFLSPHIKQVKEIYSFLKNKYPNCIILAGGPHVNAVRDEVLNCGICDYYIAGQAEIPLFNIFSHKDNNKLNGFSKENFLENVNNKKNKKYEFLEKLYTNVKLIYEDIDINKYSSWLLITDYGCPYNCSFCYKTFKGIFRFPHKFIENCIKDFTTFKNYQNKILKLTSDNVLLNFNYFIPIFNLFKKYNIKYEVVGRLDLVTKEKLEVLKNTGCKCIKYGVESGSPRILKLMNKGETLEQIENGLKITEESNLPYGMYFVANYPTETKEDRDLTIKLIKKYYPKFLAIYNFTPYPGSPVWNKILTNKEKQEYIKNDYSNMYHAGNKILNENIEYILDKTIKTN